MTPHLILAISLLLGASDSSLAEPPDPSTSAGPWYHPRCLCDCPELSLRPWSCADLEMKPVEPMARFTDCKCSALKNFFLCVPADEKKENGDNGKNANSEKAKKHSDKDETKKMTRRRARKMRMIRRKRSRTRNLRRSRR